MRYRLENLKSYEKLKPLDYLIFDYGCFAYFFEIVMSLLIGFTLFQPVSAPRGCTKDEG